MARLVLRNHRIGGARPPLVAGGRVLLGVNHRSIVRVNRVAGGAAAGSVIPRLIVGAEQIERRIHQPRLLQADDHRIGAIERAEPAIAESSGRAARLANALRRVLNATNRVSGLATRKSADIATPRQLAITTSDPDARDAFFESPAGKNYRHAKYYEKADEVPHL